jgi:hypothetical protein
MPFPCWDMTCRPLKKNSVSTRPTSFAASYPEVSNQSSLLRLPPVQSTSFHPISLRSVLILFSYPTPKSSYCSLSLRFPNQNLVCISFHIHTCHIPRPSHTPWFEYTNKFWRGTWLTKNHITYFSPASLTAPPPPIPKHLPQHAFLEHPQPIRRNVLAETRRNECHE